ncbi:metallophosphoesterase [Microlunatus capsulatus]|uniref:Metallophosphoesterase n=1 Tax=Microlunatus capsulatus TaxID=99117 RepID=A0ABS4Z621_9ACTN|nr:metallophosphoesterase [Microlunatus capsulatus]MBP2416491.1 hypothetical protein [Microlunatus capsulatus]
MVKPSNGASLTTPWAGEATKAAAAGFTDNQGVSFKASTEPGPGLVAVKRMYRSLPQDYIFTRSTTELVSAAKLFGYRDQGTTFYVSKVKADCLQPVERFRKGTRHRLAAGAADRSALLAAGWKYENVAFYAAPAGTTSAPPPTTPAPPPPTPAKPPVTSPVSNGAFSFAVVPDTQNEVLVSGDPRLTNRNQWLVKQKNLAFVAQTGDLVNWDTPDHRQMAAAKRSMDVLEDAGVPYTVSVGNHDTMATGVGGSARDPKNTYRLQRDTTTLNSYFKASDFGSVAGAYESGKVDNVFTTHTAGGLKWMVLSLEFCPRPGVVAWAKKVVAAHPDHNVLISTHSYQNGGGGIDGSNQGYGDTSGQQLFDQLVSQYPNIKMVFSGHVGLAQRARVDTGRNGNKIYSFLTTMHDPVTNPVRMFDVDPANGTVKTRIYAPLTGTTWGTYSQTLTGVQFVR